MRRVIFIGAIGMLLASCGGAGEKKFLKDTAVSSVVSDTAYTGKETDTVAGIDTAAAMAMGKEEAVERVTSPVHLQKGIDLQLSIPKGYHIAVAYEGLRRLRFLSKSPDGRLFATDMFNTSDNRRGKVYVFDGWDSVGHRFRGIHPFLE